MTEATDAAMSCFVYTADNFWGSTAADVLHVIEDCILHATHVMSRSMGRSWPPPQRSMIACIRQETSSASTLQMESSLECMSMPEPAESLGVPELHDRLQ